MTMDRQRLNPPALASGFLWCCHYKIPEFRLKSTRSCERVRPSGRGEVHDRRLNPPALASGFEMIKFFL